MKIFNQQQFKMRRNSQLIFGLYCITFLHNITPISANSIAGSSLPSTQKHHQTVITANDRLTTNGKLHKERENPSVLSIKKKNISKRSTMTDLPDEFQFDSNLETAHLENDCEYDTDLCNNHQMYDFKVNRQTPWDSQQHSNSPNTEDNSLTGEYQNSRIPSNYENYYTFPVQEINKLPEAYKQDQNNIPNYQYSSKLPGFIALALQKPKIKDWIDYNKQLSATKPEENANQEIQLINKVKKNIFTSRGWGAGGMPFSVLYMHQHTKPAARSPIAGAQQLIAPAPLRGYPIGSQYRQVAVRNALSSALTAGNNGGGSSNSPLPTRRQYSIIPQLYVSYGWGPHGK